MKKIKTVAAGVLATITLFSGAVHAFASTQNIDGREGETSGDIQVNGIIGRFDNTKPGPSPVDPDEWINVTIPTTAIFYTTADSTHTEIESPVYEVINHSAKGVTATVSEVVEVEAIDEISELSVNQVNLISDGVVTLTATDLFELEGNKSEEVAGEFVFTGTAAPSDSDKEVNPSFKLVLNFAPILEDEE